MPGCRFTPCFIQTCALTHTRWLVASRSAGASIAFIVFSGAVVCSVISLLQLAGDAIVAVEVPHFAPHDVGMLPRCVPATVGGGCFSLLWAPNAPRARSLARAALARRGSSDIIEGIDAGPVPGARSWPLSPAEQNSWVNASAFAAAGDKAECSGAMVCPDPRAAPLGSCIPCAAAMDNASIAALPQNSTQLVFWHLGAYASVDAAPGLVDDSYAILWNGSSTQAPLRRASPAAAAFRAFAEALIGDGATIEVTARDFPRASPRLSTFDALASTGAAWLWLAPALTSYAVLVDVVVSTASKRSEL